MHKDGYNDNRVTSFLSGLFVAMLIACLVIIIVAVDSALARKDEPQLPKWSVVQHNSTYSYTNYKSVPKGAYLSYGDAEEARNREKRWSDQYDAEQDQRDHPTKYWKVVSKNIPQ